MPMTLREYVKNLGKGGVKKLARGVGISEGYVYHLMRGSRRAGPELAQKIEQFSKRKVKKNSLIWADAA